MATLRESIVNVARMSGMPQDLMLDSNKDINDDPISLVRTGSNRIHEMGTKAKEGQKSRQSMSTNATHRSRIEYNHSTDV
jgi:hypothetical protein